MHSDKYKFMDSDKYTEEELKNLLQRAQRGASMWKGKVPRADDGLMEEELAAVVEELKRPDQPITKLVLMEILRYAGREAWQSNKQILEPFLEVPDAALARNALFILCEWDLAHEHLEQ
jgi:hypothetical protein